MKSVLRHALAALGLTLALLAPQAKADDGAAMRAVIEEQLQAFSRDDWADAFRHASPGIQSMFRTPDRFGAMVMQGYPMVWRPSRVEAGPVEQGPRGPVQLMYFEDQSGSLYIAAYEMVLVDGVWRIDGVRIRKAPAAAV
ncbi:MAG: DUF4864 domain-containing protein [Rhodobacteraceae bacterium]|nr:MAG: DUF4864 domain-containing protein [Paracoccaceae bacterium]